MYYYFFGVQINEIQFNSIHTKESIFFIEGMYFYVRILVLYDVWLVQ